MNCFSLNLRCTAPETGDIKTEVVPSRPPRINGWFLPLQLLQVIGWLAYSYLAIVTFGIYIPLLPQPWNHVAYAFTGISFIVHLVTHVAAVTIDPAVASVRSKEGNSNPVRLFDRTERAHVIQDQHCYLCDITVGPKVKHCGICNKCVEGFDHHCKFLNNCVGQRNYRFFFVALVSSTISVFVIILVILFIFIQHYLNPHSLRTAPQFDMLGNTTWLVFLPLAPIKTSAAGLLILAFITLMLSTVCLLLLSYLLSFHLYLFCKGISTFEYVKMKCENYNRNRDTADSCDSESNGSTSEVLEILQPRSSHQQTVRLHKYRDRHLENSEEKENSFHYGTEFPTENETREILMSVTNSWEPDNIEEDRGTSEKSISVEQAPLGGQRGGNGPEGCETLNH